MDTLANAVEDAIRSASQPSQSTPTVRSSATMAGSGSDVRETASAGTASRVESGAVSERRAGADAPASATASRADDTRIAPPERDLNETKQEVEQEERRVRTELTTQFTAVQRQMQQLMQLQAELRDLEAPSRRDIEILRARIERTERETHYAQQTLKRKEIEFKQAKAHAEKMEKQKAMLTEHLRLILYENERKKQQKLQQLEQKLYQLRGLGADVSAQPAAAAAAAAAATTAATAESAGAQR